MFLQVPIDRIRRLPDTDLLNVIDDRQRLADKPAVGNIRGLTRRQRGDLSPVQVEIEVQCSSVNPLGVWTLMVCSGA